ncbi:hypothetical protein FRC02_007723 [Tulasnella sp. 418]|nr:hypothetical protein FRC02_007723 [Tulasnella sp. 418]
MTDLRSALWQNGRDLEVQVNQRELIDKVLARYSGEFTVFRELLQNSDDADSSTAEIHFYTQAYEDEIKDRTGTRHSKESPSSSSTLLTNTTTSPLVRWTFRNDGMPFSDQEWDRLRKIAKGNPDEKKIGAFGVGFYSVFSVTDDPLVKSGTKWMSFYWKNKGNQLFTRRGDLTSPPESAPSGSPWTSFEMPLRQSSPLPGLPIDIARFLARSLTFMITLRDISVFIDDRRLVRVQKNLGSTDSLTLPTELNPRSALGTMEVKAVHAQEIRISVEAVRRVSQNSLGEITDRSEQAFEPLMPNSDLASDTGDSFEVVRSTTVLSIYSAQVDVSLDQKMRTELQRATKKNPPSTCTYSLIYVGPNEHEKNIEGNDELGVLRENIDTEGTARIFIGHATSQSTGIGGHVSAQFIPTVERESIDLVHSSVSQWNKELLYVGGYLSRFVYDMQMSKIQDTWKQAITFTDSNEVRPHAGHPSPEEQSIHAMRYFGFYPTNPSPLVGKEMESGFFSCAPDIPPLVPSTSGIEHASQVRLNDDPKLKTFVKKLPMLPENVVSRAPSMIKVLRNRGILQSVSVGDVLRELANCVLTEEEMVKCLEWWNTLDTSKLPHSNTQFGLADFLKASKFKLSPSKDGQEQRIISLSSIKFFLSRKNPILRISHLPPTALPTSMSNHFKIQTLQVAFGWVDLGVVDWIEYLISPATLDSLPEDENPTRSSGSAEKVLNLIAKAWWILSSNNKKKLKTVLSSKTVIPTRNGLRVPEQSYFSQGDLFVDLSIVEMPSQNRITGDLESMLAHLGVKRYVEMQIVIERMIDPGNWDTFKFVKYLVPNRPRIPSREFASLRRREIFPQEQIPSSGPYKTLLSELYEPLDKFRELSLPLLDWGAHEWDPQSKEASILFELGLKRYPDLPTIVKLLEQSNETRRRLTLDFYLDKFDTLYASGYKADDMRHLAFIPAIDSNGTRFLSKPDEASHINSTKKRVTLTTYR